MRFVPIKNNEQQALLGLHRARQGFVVGRTAQANQIRGLLSEFGLVIPVGIRSIESKLPEMIEDADNGLSGASWSERLALGIATMQRADACRRFQGSVRLRPVRWWRASGMRGSFTMVVSLLRGSGWCHDKTPPVASQLCLGSANGVTRTCEHC
jgi:transposase